MPVSMGGVSDCVAERMRLRSRRWYQGAIRDPICIPATPICIPVTPFAFPNHPEEVNSQPSAWLPWNYPKAVTASALDHDPPGLPK